MNKILGFKGRLRLFVWRHRRASIVALALLLATSVAAIFFHSMWLWALFFGLALVFIIVFSIE